MNNAQNQYEIDPNKLSNFNKYNGNDEYSIISKLKITVQYSHFNRI